MTLPRSRASHYVASHGFSRSPLTYAANMLAQFDGDAARAIDALAGYTLRPDYHAGVAAHLAAMGSSPNKRQRKAMRKSASRTYTEANMTRTTGAELLERAADYRATAAHELARWHGARHVSHAQDAKRAADSAMRDCRQCLKDARWHFEQWRDLVSAAAWVPEPAPVAPIKLTLKAAAPAPVQTIDCAPTWESLVPALIAVLQNGTGRGHDVARDELNRLARYADSAIARAKNPPPAPVAAVVICPLDDGESEVFGPFSDGGAACAWARENVQTGRRWYWEAMRAASTISA